jgi:hypothetical protein
MEGSDYGQYLNIGPPKDETGVTFGHSAVILISNC